MQETKKPSASLWVGLLALGLTFLSVYASAEEANPEDDVKQSLGQLLGGSHQDGETDKSARCEESARAAVRSGTETRSAEELSSICLALPNTHDIACGFPSSGEEYFVIENQRCVTKVAGRSLLHAHARKVETRSPSDYGTPGYDPDECVDDCGTTGAQ